MLIILRISAMLFGKIASLTISLIEHDLNRRAESGVCISLTSIIIFVGFQIWQDSTWIPWTSRRSCWGRLSRLWHNRWIRSKLIFCSLYQRGSWCCGRGSFTLTCHWGMMFICGKYVFCWRVTFTVNLWASNRGCTAWYAFNRVLSLSRINIKIDNNSWAKQNK